jgi:hypothetical protein
VVSYTEVSADGGVDVETIGPNDRLLTFNALGGVDGDNLPFEGGSNLSIDGYGRFLLTYTGSASADVSEIYSHRSLLEAADPAQVSTLANDNTATRNASSANGTSVVVWVNTKSSTNHDIYAQRYDAQGKPSGPVIAVDTSSADSYGPTVAMDASGRFVVAWEQLNTDGTWSVMMRYYSASGSPLTGITQVTARGSTDYYPDVAASNGSFVISWNHHTSPTNDDIWAERFVISGGVPHGQGIFSVNSDSNSESASSVAMSPGGRFDIVYERQFSGGDWDIFASQYGSGGNLLRSNIHINFDSNPEFNPSVSMDNAGNAVVAYEEDIGTSSGVFANRLSAAGVVGPRITVANGGGFDYRAPSVALSPTTGAFVVAVDTNGFFDPNTFDFENGVYTVEFSANDTALEPVFDGIGGANDGSVVSVSIDSHNRYLVTFVNSSGSRDEVYGLRDYLS